MSALTTVFKKELRDMFRDRRTVVISLVIGTLLGPVLMFGMLKLMVNRMSSQMEKPLVLPVVGAEHAPNLVNWLKGQNIVIKSAPQRILMRPLPIKVKMSFFASARTSEPSGAKVCLPKWN